MAKAVASVAEHDAFVRSAPGAVLQFGAPWSQPSKMMNNVVAALAEDHAPGGAVAFATVDGEAAEDVTVACGVSVVPATVLYLHGKVFDRVSGANAAELNTKVEKLAEAARQGAPASAGGLEARLKALIGDGDAVLFMKGTPDAPRCKFSRKVVDILNEDGVKYRHFDILSDNDVREGLKKYSNWPTYPQFYAAGQLLGGCDIIEELHASGELGSTVQDALGAPQPPGGSLEDRLKALIAKEPIMLFMKGSPDAPRCGFSAKVAAALAEEGVKFGHFDILTDNDVREGLKKLSDWPTYPQLYVKGELMGGCDVVLEMKQDGELKSAIEEQLAA